jgi:hypothetical protein
LHRIAKFAVGSGGENGKGGEEKDEQEEREREREECARLVACTLFFSWRTGAKLHPKKLKWKLFFHTFLKNSPNLITPQKNNSPDGIYMFLVN